MSKTNCSILCFAVALLVGCTLPFKTPEIRGASPRTAVGIAELLNRDDVNEIDVVMIHGMCTHGKNWVAESNNTLLKMLGVDKEIKPDSLPPPRVFSKTELYSLNFEKAKKRIHTHSIVWSPATVPLKAALCYDHSADRVDSTAYCQSAPLYPDKRASLNSFLKSHLLDDCLADAMVYVGPANKQIKDQVALAITYAAGGRAKSKTLEGIRAQAQAEETPMFIISESLGSKILFDTLIDMFDKGEKQLVSQTVARVVQIFMAANQIPVLSLAMPEEAAGIRAAPGVAADSLDSLLQRVQGTENLKLRAFDRYRPPGPRQVVAFSDPNDLLSYTLYRKGHAQHKLYKIVDVVVSNSKTWFGLVENPLAAHTSYLQNRSVDKIIACGIGNDNAACDVN